MTLVELIQETIDFYYNRNGTEKNTRSVYSETDICRYVLGEKRCAASRLNPDADWQEGQLYLNNGIALDGLKSRGIVFSKPNAAMLFLQHLQRIHDNGSNCLKIERTEALNFAEEYVQNSKGEWELK